MYNVKTAFTQVLNFEALAAVVLMALRWCSCTEQKSFKTLEPDAILYNQVLFDDQVSWYGLNNLMPNTTYELRVSYPAVVPTEFTIKVHEPNQSSNFKSRYLLNIEKTVFKAGSSKQGYVAEVTAHRIGFPRNSERLKDPVVFNIVLETLHFGLSSKSWKMVCYTIALCVIAFKLIVPALHRLIMSKVVKYDHQS